MDLRTAWPKLSLTACGLLSAVRGPVEYIPWPTTQCGGAAVACPHLFVGTNEAIGRTKAHSRSTQPLKLQYFRNGRSFFGYHFRKSSRSRETPRIHSFDSGGKRRLSGQIDQFAAKIETASSLAFRRS